MASQKVEKIAGAGSLLPGQAKQEPPKAAATPAAPKAPAASATKPAAKPAAPKKSDPKPTSQPKKKAPTAGKK